MIRIPFRPTLRRTTAIPAAFGVALTLAAFTYPGGLACAYDDLRDLENHRKSMSESKQQSNYYDANLANLTDRMAIKEQYIADLIAGRSTLRETTRLVLELNRTNEATWQAIDSCFPGDNMEEKTARSVMEFVRSQVSYSPAPSNTPQRIAAQFREMFGKEISIK